MLGAQPDAGAHVISATVTSIKINSTLLYILCVMESTSVVIVPLYAPKVFETQVHWKNIIKILRSLELVLLGVKNRDHTE